MGELNTYYDFKRAFDRLSDRQRAWVRNKSSWEQMSLWAVMREWSIPASKNLRLDGTWR